MTWENEYVQVYEYHLDPDEKITAHEEEISETQFVSPQKLHEMLIDPSVEWSLIARETLKHFPV